jgi:hypothetical protein
MDNYVELQARLNLLEYHQMLLLKLLTDPNLEFYRLVIENGISEHEVEAFNLLCDNLNIKMEIIIDSLPDVHYMLIHYQKFTKKDS